VAGFYRLITADFAPHKVVFVYGHYLGDSAAGGHGGNGVGGAPNKIGGMCADH
jgi:hypothetical protein